MLQGGDRDSPVLIGKGRLAALPPRFEGGGFFGESGQMVVESGDPVRPLARDVGRSPQGITGEQMRFRRPRLRCVGGRLQQDGSGGVPLFRFDQDRTRLRPEFEQSVGALFERGRRDGTPVRSDRGRSIVGGAGDLGLVHVLGNPFAQATDQPQPLGHHLGDLAPAWPIADGKPREYDFQLSLKRLPLDGIDWFCSRAVGRCGPHQVELDEREVHMRYGITSQPDAGLFKQCCGRGGPGTRKGPGQPAICQFGKIADGGLGPLCSGVGFRRLGQAGERHRPAEQCCGARVASR